MTMPEVQLAGDLQPLLDEDALDELALGAGLVRHQRHADHLRGEPLGFLGRLGELDAAALAAAAGVDLRLDDDRPPEPLRDVARLRRRVNATSPRGTGTP